MNDNNGHETHSHVKKKMKEGSNKEILLHVYYIYEGYTTTREKEQRKDQYNILYN